MVKRQHGMALILVMWSLVLMTGLATGFAYAVRYETRTTSDVAGLAYYEAAREAGLRYVVLALTAINLEDRWQPDGQPHQIDWQGNTVSVRLQSESGRIDLNRAPRDLLIGLFDEVLPDAPSAALADAVIDWRDRDDKTSPDGAEAREYARAGYAYGPTNLPFYSVQELSQVVGFDREMMESLTPFLTVHGLQPRVHVVSATATTLAAIPGISRAEAEAFVAYRDAAIAAGEPLRFDRLRAGRQYLDTRSVRRIYSVELAVRNADGVSRREHLVMRVDPTGRFSVMLRETLPTAEVLGSGAASPATEEVAS